MSVFGGGGGGERAIVPQSLFSSLNPETNKTKKERNENAQPDCRWVFALKGSPSTRHLRDCVGANPCPSYEMYLAGIAKKTKTKTKKKRKKKEEEEEEEEEKER